MSSSATFLALFSSLTHHPLSHTTLLARSPHPASVSNLMDWTAQQFAVIADNPAIFSPLP